MSRMLKLKERFSVGGRRLGKVPEIVELAHGERTAVDRYWSDHTVNSRPFRTAQQSADYLEWRFGEYPHFREFMDLWGEHAGKVILDYGCGPGNDVTGFLLYSGAEKVIGVDVSPKALALAQTRVARHGIDPARVALIRITDDDPSVPLEEESVDFINCGGVLHHTSRPDEILADMRRVLRPSGDARIMVYNRDSIWFHLYTAYVKMLVEGAYEGLTVDEAFALNTDGEECPISRAYEPAQFIELAQNAGFDAEFLGGYLSRHELNVLAEFGEVARGDARLASEHRTFLSGLELDETGLPLYRGKLAGIGGSYHLRPRA